MSTYEKRLKINYLKRYERLEKKIKNSEEELARWRSRAATTITNYHNANIPNSIKKNMQASVEKAEEVSQTIREDIKKYKIIRREIKDKVEELDDVDAQEIIELRYLQGYSVRQISFKLQKSESLIYQTIDKALKKLKM